MLRLNSSAKFNTGLILGLVLFAACQRFSTSSSAGGSISGVLKDAGSATIRLSELDVKAVRPIDSVIVGKDGKFRFELKPAESSFYVLSVAPFQKIILVADSAENIHIAYDLKNSPASIRIEGSPASSWLLDFNRFTIRNEAKSDSLARIFMNSRSDSGFAGIRQHLDSAYAEIVSLQKLYMEKFIYQHPSSLASLIVLNHKFGPNFIFKEDRDIAYFIKVDSGLMANYPGNKHTVDHHNRVVALLKKQSQRRFTDSLMMPGNPVPDIQLHNAEGMPVSLATLKGNVVLVYFWSAMDGRSRKFIRNLIPIYKANRNQGFRIYGVALEPNKTLWLKALKLDQPEGIQVNAFGGFESPVAALFGIDSLPEATLINRHGIIIKRKISPDELSRILPKQLQLK